MHSVLIRAWGNSQGIILPKEISERMDLKVSDVLNIEIEKGAIVLRKQFVHKSFEERLSDYNGKISVGDFEWGEPKGRELL